MAIDRSETASHAFEYVVEHIRRPQDHLRLIHVQPYHEVADVVSGGHMSAVPIYSAGKVRQESIDIAQKYAAKCKNLGIEDFKEDIILEDGSSGAAICEYIEGFSASEKASATLVLGSRELGFFGRAFLGSTSEHCVRHCPCPVLVVKMPKK